MKRIAILMLFLALAMSGCFSNEPDEPPAIKPPYLPDDRGSVTSISVQEIQLDGRRSYPINAFVKSFSAYLPAEAEPVMRWKNRYVHIGLNDDREIVWVAGIGVIDKAIDPPTVYYTNGVVDESKDGKIFLADGTVFELKEGFEVPEGKEPVTLYIDASKHEVYKFVPRGA